MPYVHHVDGANSLKNRLFKRIVIEEKTGCWRWTGSVDQKGYGGIAKGGGGQRTLLKAHRASWEIHKGPIPKGLLVLHKCDFPSCVNPDHLFLGTAAENTADMIAKGRHSSGINRPQSKLVWSQVDAIRELCPRLTNMQLARLCGVSQSVISEVKTGKIWKQRDHP